MWIILQCVLVLHKPGLQGQVQDASAGCQARCTRQYCMHWLHQNSNKKTKPVKSSPLVCQESPRICQESPTGLSRVPHGSVKSPPLVCQESPTGLSRVPHGSVKSPPLVCQESPTGLSRVTVLSRVPHWSVKSPHGSVMSP